MREYARQRGLKRLLIPVPLLTPRLSSLWLGLVTPLYARVGRKLVDSLRNPTVVRDPAALAAFPVQPRGVREAIARALVNEDEAFAANALVGRRLLVGSDRALRRRSRRHAPGRQPQDVRSGAAGRRPSRRSGASAATPAGTTATFLWRLRGFLDLLVGGVGLRRGRRHADELGPGDALDFWRVESFEPDRLLRLRAEMKVPGRAWLQFETTPVAGGTEIRQTAIFDASGLFGLAYWYALYPLHRFVFAGMLRAIADRAQRSAGATKTREVSSGS